MTAYAASLFDAPGDWQGARHSGQYCKRCSLRVPRGSAEPCSWCRLELAAVGPLRTPLLVPIPTIDTTRRAESPRDELPGLRAATGLRRASPHLFQGDYLNYLRWRRGSTA